MTWWIIMFMLFDFSHFGSLVSSKFWCLVRDKSIIPTLLLPSVFNKLSPPPFFFFLNLFFFGYSSQIKLDICAVFSFKSEKKGSTMVQTRSEACFNWVKWILLLGARECGRQLQPRGDVTSGTLKLTAPPPKKQQVCMHACDWKLVRGKTWNWI